MITATGHLGGIETVIAAMEYSFIGGSMGVVVGEKITRAIERAVDRRAPVIIVSCSGGARMMEGALSLMQMAKTAAALARLDRAGLPFISVLTDPTTGGVTASFAMLGDLNIAEPKALIGFAGPRVIEQTIRQKLPEGFQRSEFLLEHGMLDMVVDRRELKATISRALRVHGLHGRVRGAGAGSCTGLIRVAAIGSLHLILHSAFCISWVRPVDPLSYLFGLEKLGIKFGLENIGALCAALGDPQRAYPTVIVAGTNGKGSVAAMVETGLRAAGLRTGLYTSPHLVRLEERFAIGGRPVDHESHGRGRRARCRRPSSACAGAGTLAAQPTFFEVTTAIGFELFRRAEVEVAVLEVGLGGRFDATNVADPIAGGHHHDRLRPRAVPRSHHRADRLREGRGHQARDAGRGRRAQAGGAGGDCQRTAPSAAPCW